MAIENNRAANLISQSRKAQAATNPIKAMSELNLQAYCINLDSETNRNCTASMNMKGPELTLNFRVRPMVEMKMYNPAQLEMRLKRTNGKK